MLLGRQIITKFESCEQEILLENTVLLNAITKLVTDSGLHTVNFSKHEFVPFGVTFVWILTESHLVVHTWPEANTLLLDIFLCQTGFDIDEFHRNLRNIIKAKSKIEIIDRQI